MTSALALKADKTYVDSTVATMGSSSGSLTHDFSVQNLAVSGNILPAISGVSTIGSPTDKFAAVYTKELHIDANTLYVDGVPVIGSSANTIQITADVNQGMRIATTGTGQLILDSQTATTVQTNGTNADVVFQAIGTGSLARITSGTQVVLTAPVVNIQGSESISGDLTVAGNMTVNGTTTAVNTTNMTVKDNIVTVNKGELGSGVSLRYAGFEVDRGDLARERLIWDETVGKWVAGQTSQEVALATEIFVAAAVATSASSVTVSSLGLSNVSNTSDANKPISTAQATAIALKADMAVTYTKTQVDDAIAGATPSFSTLTGKPTTLSGFGVTDAMTATAIAAAIAVESTRATTAEGLKASQANTYTKTETDSAIQAVVGAAPEALNTLAEIATQLASDESAAAALVNTVATKVDKVTGKGLSTEDYTTAEKTKLATVTGTNTGDETLATIKTKLGVTTLSGVNTGDQVLPTLASLGAQAAGTYAAGTGSASGVNTGDETTATIKTKLGVTTLSGSNTGDQVIPTTLPASDVSAWAKSATKPTYTATELSLGNVNNTTDLLKPVSTATQTALDLKAPQSTTYTKTETDTRIQAVVGAAPLALDTLVEIAAQLASDESAAAALTTAVSLKAPLASPTFTGTVSGITKAMVGLGSVDNTTDATKPVSTAQAAAIAVETSRATAAEALKAPLASPTFTGTVSGITKAMVGLGSVDNTTDATKPVSTATQTALNLKANSAALGTMSAQSASAVAITGGTIDNVVFNGGTY
jgi:hypothetical protein